MNAARELVRVAGGLGPLLDAGPVSHLQAIARAEVRRLYQRLALSLRSEIVVLSSNAGHFTPTRQQGAEPYVALRLFSGLLSVLAAVVAIGGGLIAIFVILVALGSAGAAARFAPGGVTAGILGAGLLGGLLVALGTIFYALLLWSASQAIRVLLSIEGHARESAALQRAMLAELARIAAGVTAPPTSR